MNCFYLFYFNNFNTYFYEKGSVICRHAGRLDGRRRSDCLRVARATEKGEAYAAPSTEFASNVGTHFTSYEPGSYPDLT